MLIHILHILAHAKLKLVTCVPSITQPFQGSDNTPADFSSTVPSVMGKLKTAGCRGAAQTRQASGEAKLHQKASTSALLLAHSGRLALMAVCELAGLAGVLCRLLTQPTPAAAATMSQLARMAADMIAHPGGNAVNPSPINGVSPCCHECCTRLDCIYSTWIRTALCSDFLRLTSSQNITRRESSTQDSSEVRHEA